MWGQISSARIENLRDPPSPGLETVSLASPPVAFCLAAPFIAPKLEAVETTSCSGIDETMLSSGEACAMPPAASPRTGVSLAGISDGGFFERENFLRRRSIRWRGGAKPNKSV